METKIGIFAALAAALLIGGNAAVAQSYPDHSIRMVIPFPPAGATDVLGRAIGQKLADSLGQPVVIENRPGAGSTLGAAVVAKAAPDGYTILLASGSMPISASLYPKGAPNPATEFEPVTLVATAPHILVTNVALPVANLKELIAYAKSNPGKLAMASQGNGTLSHMELELLKSAAGIDVLHVPYKGSTGMMNDILAGNVNLFFDSVTSSLPFVKRGQLRAMGVVSKERLASAPEIPTLAEAGLPGLDASNWFGVFVPATTPKPIVQKLHDHLVKVLASPDLQQLLAKQDLLLQTSTPEEMGTIVKDDMARWGALIKKNGIKIQ